MGCLVLILFVAGLCNLGDTVNMYFDMKNTRGIAMTLQEGENSFIIDGYHQGPRKKNYYFSFLTAE